LQICNKCVDRVAILRYRFALMKKALQQELGRKIRELRKEKGLTMQQLAEMVGVNYTTIHRVETGRVSPSVVLLSEIAHRLGRSAASLLEDQMAQITLIRKEDQPEVESDKMKLRLLVPQGVINDKISISFCKANPGEFVDKHQTKGFELPIILKGRCVFRYGGRDYEMKEGDLAYFDGNVWHSVMALEPLEFIALYFRE
jgi:transcriptional regulator with XRE-family HTH domain